MRTPEHTPGPWYTHPQRDGLIKIDFCDMGAGSGIATIENYGDEGKANARLIAAAPELVDILDEFVCQYGCHCGHPACNDCGRTQEAERVMRKAKGEPE